jgi:glycerol kinase
MALFLGIDQSTSATKALLFNQEGELLDQLSLSHRQIYPSPGWVEHDAEEIYQNTLRVVCDLLKKLAEEPVSLCITNQRETFVVFDRNSGKPLYNAIVWQCRRGEPICREMVAAGYAQQVEEKTGLRIDTYFPASKIKWLLEERPDIRRQVVDGRALIGTIDAYLVYRLTGGKLLRDRSYNASRTLLYDITRLKWSRICASCSAYPLTPPRSARELGLLRRDRSGRLPLHSRFRFMG